MKQEKCPATLRSRVATAEPLPPKRATVSDLDGFPRARDCVRPAEDFDREWGWIR